MVVVLNDKSLEKYKAKINSFLERNIDAYTFFHPHKFTFEALRDEVLHHPKDLYCLLYRNKEIYGFIVHGDTQHR